MKREGRDVVIGYVEPHARPENPGVDEGLEAYRDWKSLIAVPVLNEFDLDATLARKPEFVLSTNWPTRMHLAAVTRSVGKMSRNCSLRGINVLSNTKRSACRIAE